MQTALVLLAVFAIDPKEPLENFAGFSADGQRFVWVAPGASKAMKSRFVKIVSVGKHDPELSLLMPDPQSEKETREKLKDFSGKKKPAPADVKLDTALAQKPPKLAIVRGDKRVAVDVGPAPFEKTDVAQVWGVSADGKHVAVVIHGPDVPGVLSKGGGNDFIEYVIAPVP